MGEAAPLHLGKKSVVLLMVLIYPFDIGIVITAVGRILKMIVFFEKKISKLSDFGVLKPYINRWVRRGFEARN